MFCLDGLSDLAQLELPFGELCELSLFRKRKRPKPLCPSIDEGFFIFTSKCRSKKFHASQIANLSKSLKQAYDVISFDEFKKDKSLGLLIQNRYEVSSHNLEKSINYSVHICKSKHYPTLRLTRHIYCKKGRLIGINITPETGSSIYQISNSKFSNLKELASHIESTWEKDKVRTAGHRLRPTGKSILWWYINFQTECFQI